GEMEALEDRIPEAVYRDIRELLEAALIGADRIAQIIRNIKLFARPSNAPAEFVDVSSALALSAKMVECELDTAVQLDLALSQVPAIIGRRVEIEQVFINLLKNAVHALADKPQDSPRICASSRADDEGHVVVDIVDNGPGIDDDILDKIFDPFFTTKPVD